MIHFHFANFARRFVQRIPLLISAALVAVVIHDAFAHPLRCVALLLLSTCALFPPFLARRRLKKIMLSGDVAKVLSIWLPAARSHPDHDTAEPLVAATAFVAYGWVSEARNQLARVGCKLSSTAAMEHRLFVETLIEAFDGDREQAVHLANSLASLPLPEVDSGLKNQVILLRCSLVALARAFAHCSHDGDLDTLVKASNNSPLVSWAMRYAAAIVALDRGDVSKVPPLLNGAPSWPNDSMFRAFHDEISARIESRQ